MLSRTWVKTVFFFFKRKAFNLVFLIVCEESRALVCRLVNNSCIAVCIFLYT